MSVVTTSRPPHKGHSAPARRTDPPEDKAHLFAVQRALAACPANRDAAEIVRVGEKLVALVEEYLDTHGNAAFVDALRAAGLEAHVLPYHLNLGANLRADLSGLLYVLDLTLSIVDGEVTHDTPTTTKPRRSR